MNRIVNLALPAIVALVFFLITCSNPEPQTEPSNPIVGSGDSSSSGDIVGDLPSSSSQNAPVGGPGEQESSSSIDGEATLSSSSGEALKTDSSDSGQGASSSSTDSLSSADKQNGSSSSGTLVSSGTSSVSGSSSSRSGSSSSRSGSSSSRLGSSSSQSSSGTASSSSVRSSSSVSAVPPVNTPKADFKEKVGNVEFDMIYIPGGTFTIGCESGTCPADAKPVSGVEVSSYFIAKTEVKNGLWKAVMGSDIPPPNYASNSGSATHITWYDAQEFACKLSNLTGRKYHMTTEAEWEYAAKKYKDKLSDIGGGSGVGGEEWAYNSWNSTHMGGKDPVGPGSGMHTQKTRRDANGTADNITGRLIRSIEGIGPALRLAVSADMNYPPTYVSPCDLHAPKMEGEPTNSYRDPRWVTGSNAMWVPNGTIAIGGFGLRAWEDGTARLCSGWNNSCTNGQWFSSNNITFVFVPSSGSIKRYAYIFLDAKQGSLISDGGFTNGYIGRIEKRDTTSYEKPTVAGLKSGEELARAQDKFETDYKMIDMTNIPASAKKQDARLLDGTDKAWFQDNRQAGGVHHYRKDVDADEFRFTVNQPPSTRTMLANGTWFTVNNTFLRVTHKDGYVAEYLYAVDADGTFYHNSFMGYERGDFRMFKKVENSNTSLWQATCQSACNGEIPKNQAASMYSSQGATGKSTFVPAPCPSGGCR